PEPHLASTVLDDGLNEVVAEPFLFRIVGKLSAIVAIGPATIGAEPDIPGLVLYDAVHQFRCREHILPACEVRYWKRERRKLRSIETGYTIHRAEPDSSIPVQHHTPHVVAGRSIRLGVPGEIGAIVTRNTA